MVSLVPSATTPSGSSRFPSPSDHTADHKKHLYMYIHQGFIQDILLGGGGGGGG